jgi:hypothetical protein
MYEINHRCLFAVNFVFKEKIAMAKKKQLLNSSLRQFFLFKKFLAAV